jgi:hypothetical protein
MFKRFTKEQFHEKLAAGGYAHLRAANCAVSRAVDWNQKEKEVARKAAENFFNGEESFYVSKAAKTAAKERVTAKAQAAAEKQAETSPALRFAVDFQAIRNSKLRPEVRRMLQAAMGLGVPVEEIIVALG